jgi:uncharacterized protein (TIGR00369 family)
MAIWHGDASTRFGHSTALPTLSRHLGIEYLELGDDCVTGRMPVDERTRQPGGVLHGGASVALAESLMSHGANLCIDRSRHYCVGQEINANHLRAVREGWVIGTARPVHVGRTTQVWQCEIRSESGALVCVSRMTLAVLARPEPPRGAP